MSAPEIPGSTPEFPPEPLSLPSSPHAEHTANLASPALLPAERLPGFGNVYPPPGALSSNRRYDPSAPEVRIPRLPKVLRSRIPRARPYAPEKEVEAESDSEPPLVDAFLPMDNQFTISMAEPEEPEETT